MERFWGRKYLHLQRRGAVPTDWLTLQDLDSFFQSEGLPANLIHVVAEGRDIPIAEWSKERDSAWGHYRVPDFGRLSQCYRKGATLILNQAQLAIPRLSAACRLLTSELGFRVWTNVYVTPPGASGFAWHHDEHEVLILQILGSKDWIVLPPDEDPVNLCMEANDLLYLPRGTDHSARTGTEAASIHLTFGMLPAYGFDLVEQLAAMAREHPAFQRLVPVVDSAPGIVDRFTAEFASQLTALFADAGVEGLLTRRLINLAQNQGQSGPGRFAGMVLPGRISAQTLVRLRPGVLYTASENEEFVKIHLSGQTLSIPVFLREMLALIASGRPFAIGEAPGLLSDKGRIELIESFVRAGLLEIVGTA